MQEVALSALNIDGGTQPREVIDTRLAEEYALAMGTGAAFPPVVVFFDGSTYWLADGFHRHYAHRVLKRETIECDVRQGTQRDAILFSVGANATHGLRRTNEDKRRAVMTLLKDPEWSRWSDSEIARRCAVSAEMVRKARPAPPISQPLEDRRTVSRGGTTYTMKTAAIGSRDVERGKKEGALPFAPASPAGQPQVAARPEQPAKQEDGGGQLIPFQRAPEVAAPSVVTAYATGRGGTSLDSLRAHGWISVALLKIEREIDSLPKDAAHAARVFPMSHRYAFPAQKLRYMADWLSAFADEWALIEQENRNVAAQ